MRVSERHSKTDKQPQKDQTPGAKCKPDSQKVASQEDNNLCFVQFSMYDALLSGITSTTRKLL